MSKIDFLSRLAARLGLGISQAAGAGYWITESDGSPIDPEELQGAGYCPSKECLETDLIYLHWRRGKGSKQYESLKHG